MKTVFLDRDGVINENRPDHVKCWDEFVFLPGVLDSLRRLHAAGWQVIVVTNQAIIHRHIVPQAVVEDINGRMVETVKASGGAIDAVLYCPHDSTEGCDCRKPKPGLLLQAAHLFDLRLGECYLVGDAFTDIAAGQAAGCATLLVQTGRGRQQLTSAEAYRYTHYHVTPNLPMAVNWLIWAERRRALRQRLFPLWTSARIYRNQHENDGYQAVSPDLIPVQLEPGGASSSYADANMPNGQWYHRIEAVNGTGQTVATDGPTSAVVTSEYRLFLPVLAGQTTDPR